MSPYDRRAGIKIVGPLDQNREKELIGGIRNALERGESLAKAKQTFINAGYQPREIATAVQKLPQGITPLTTPVSATPITPVGKPGEILQASSLPTLQPKKKSKILTILIIIVLALVLIGAGLLGVFWNSWFGN